MGKIRISVTTDEGELLDQAEIYVSGDNNTLSVLSHNYETVIPGSRCELRIGNDVLKDE